MESNDRVIVLLGDVVWTEGYVIHHRIKNNGDDDDILFEK